MATNPDDYQSRSQIKQMFQEGKLKAGDKKAIKEVSETYIVSEKLAVDYIEHLTDIEMRKYQFRLNKILKKVSKNFSDNSLN